LLTLATTAATSATATRVLKPAIVLLPGVVVAGLEEKRSEIAGYRALLQRD